jgi:hypothetical protein
MQLESSDESLACWVGLQSTPSSGVRETAECRDVLSAANGSAAVEDSGDAGVITTWAASASDVCDGSAFRLAHGDGWFQRRGQPLSLIDCAGGPAARRSVGALAVGGSGIERSGQSGLGPNRRRGFRGWDREHVSRCVLSEQ